MSKIISTITIPSAAAKTGGALQGFVWDQFVDGHKILREDGEVKIYGLDANVQPTFSDLQTIVSSGGSFDGIKVAIRFTNEAAIQQNVPSVVRGATYLDENEVEQTRTWEQWFKSNASVRVITNGTAYIVKAVYNHQLLNSEELAAIHQQTGVRVIEWTDAVALYQDENWTGKEVEASVSTLKL